MSNPNPKTDANALTPPTTHEQFEQERVTRRAMLRRLGLTAGASLFGLMAADDIVRAALTRMQQTEALRGVANTVAVEFRNAGVAFAQTSGGGPTICGVTVIPCKNCAPDLVDTPLNRGLSTPCFDPYCIKCQAPYSCADCDAVADYAYCNCKQKIINDNPECFDTNGQPYGNCPQITEPLVKCLGDRENAC